MNGSQEEFTGAESYLVKGYISLTTILTISLNSLLLFLLVTKVKISRCPSSIPVVPMSLLGLVQGCTTPLMITVTLYGQLDLQEYLPGCTSVSVLQGHVATAYIANICCIALEAAWAMSHRFASQGHGPLYLILACTVSTLIPLPVSVVLGSRDTFSLHPRLLQCVRVWGPANKGGFAFYVAYMVVLALLFGVCLAACLAVVYVYIRKSKKEFHRSTFQDSKARKRAQDVSAAKSAMTLTWGSGLAWLPSLVAALLMATHPLSFMAELTTWLSFSLFWVSPLLCLYKNTALQRAMACLKTDLTKTFRCLE